MRENQQLWYTIFVAGVILLAFIFIANQFVAIAQDAQDRLINVRLGAMQEAVAEFVPDYLATDNEILQNKIRRIAFQNSTIQEFKIIEFRNGDPVVVASIATTDIGQVDQENLLNYDVAKTNPQNSFTFEESVSGERVFTTVRLITNNYGDGIAAVLTRQSLSEADLKISSSIQNSIFIFIIIIVLVMFLFFRHARILDYTVLYKKLQSLDRLKDDFISMASHELRTPLTIIRGYAEDLLGMRRLSRAVKKDVERIDIAAVQLDNLVNDMLDVSRIEQGRLKIVTTAIDPTPIVEEVVFGLRSEARAKKLKMTLENNLDGVKDFAKIDPDRFRQVITNLIGNAIKYTQKGSIKINLYEKADAIVVRVSDTGIGMTAEERSHLFLKFYRVRNEETADVHGTGLGLWITKQLVMLMGGRISVESIKGVGTHIVVGFRKIRPDKNSI